MDGNTHNKRQKHFRHKTYISSRKHAQFMIRGYHVQIQPTPSPLHCDLEHIHRIPSTKLCVCVCVCVCMCVCVCAYVCVCDIYFKICISKVTLYKIHGRYYVERGSAFSFLFFFFFFFFLRCYLLISKYYLKIFQGFKAHIL